MPLAWGLGVRTFDATTLGLATSHDNPDPLIEGVTDRARLDVPTYDGSGQVVHPDVLLEPGRLVMAITPYPYSDGRFENPSLVVSADGMAFQAFGTNPIVPPPPFDHNDDPDIRRDPRTGELELLSWRRCVRSADARGAAHGPGGGTRRDAIGTTSRRATRSSCHRPRSRTAA